MTNIVMCQSEQCPKNKECFRYMAITETDYQNYSDFEAINCNTDFKWFYEIGNRKIRENENIEKIESLGE
ncbi:MAG: hypothetical protein PHE29_13945 [Tissierellia bacterium]|nr:hypothetical protein [Tissierellia bacterium]